MCPGVLKRDDADPEVLSRPKRVAVPRGKHIPKKIGPGGHARRKIRPPVKNQRKKPDGNKERPWTP